MMSGVMTIKTENLAQFECWRISWTMKYSAQGSLIAHMKSIACYTDEECADNTSALWKKLSQKYNYAPAISENTFLVSRNKIFSGSL